MLERTKVSPSSLSFPSLVAFPFTYASFAGVFVVSARYCHAAVSPEARKNAPE